MTMWRFGARDESGRRWGSSHCCNPCSRFHPIESERDGLRLGGVGDARWRWWGQRGLRTYRWYGGGLQEDRASKPIARNSHGSCRPCLRYKSRRGSKGHVMFFWFVFVFCLRLPSSSSVFVVRRRFLSPSLCLCPLGPINLAWSRLPMRRSRVALRGGPTPSTGWTVEVCRASAGSSSGRTHAERRARQASLSWVLHGGRGAGKRCVSPGVP